MSDGGGKPAELTEPGSPVLPVEVDMARPSGARIYDYNLGGKDNFQVDRDVAEAMNAVLPELPLMARANRQFLIRAVWHLARDWGIRQFLDVGSGLPTMSNVHQVAQGIDPAARVVYVDNDPMVVAHSRALLSSSPAGRVAVVQADATDPCSILAAPQLAQTVGLDRPVAVMLVSMLMYFDDATAHRVVSTLMDAMPSGSYLTLSHPTADFTEAFAVEQAQKAAAAAGITYRARTRAQITAFFDGLELCEPGVVPMADWRPDPTVARFTTGVATIHYYVGMARKP